MSYLLESMTAAIWMHVPSTLRSWTLQTNNMNYVSVLIISISTVLCTQIGSWKLPQVMWYLIVVAYMKTCASPCISMKIFQSNIFILSIIVFDISHMD